MDFYAFNDTHGTVVDPENGSAAGLAKISTYAKRVSKDQNAVFVSSGDMFQGSIESNYTQGKLVTEWMNDLGFVSMTYGNHEFDWGVNGINEARELADFPFLGINIVDRTTGERASYAEPSVVVERAGIKIGIIGAIGNCYSSISARHVKDVRFEIGSTLTNLVKNEANRLRNEENCDIIIYSVHGTSYGSEVDSEYDYSLSENGYVDLVLEGHSHQEYTNIDSYGVYHVQSAGYDQDFSHIEIEVKKGSKPTVKGVEHIETDDLLGETPDATVTNLINVKYYDSYAFAYGTLGYNSSYRSSNSLLELVASLYLEDGMKKWGGDYQIFLAGGYMSCRSPYNLPAGPVTYADLSNLFPFDNDLVLCSVSGSKLDSQFVNSTNSNYHIAYTSYGQANRESINSSATYYIITDTYSSDYSYNGLTEIEYLTDTGRYMRDLLADYIRDGRMDERTSIDLYLSGTFNQDATNDTNYHLTFLGSNHYRFEGLTLQSNDKVKVLRDYGGYVTNSSTYTDCNYDTIYSTGHLGVPTAGTYDVDVYLDGRENPVVLTLKSSENPPVQSDYDHEGTASDPYSIADILKLGAKLDSSTSTDKYPTEDFVYVQGYVTGKNTSGSYFLGDSQSETSNVFTLYGVKDATNQGKLLEGALVTVCCRVMNFSGTIETYSTSESGFGITVVTPGTAWNDGYTEVSVAEAREIADAGTGGSTLYKTTGILNSIDVAYSSQYGNITITIGELTDPTVTIKVYRLSCTEAQASEMQQYLNDGWEYIITVGGQLTKYNGTLEFASGCVILAVNP